MGRVPLPSRHLIRMREGSRKAKRLLSKLERKHLGRKRSFWGRLFD